MAINEKKFNDKPYVAFLNGTRIELYAQTLYAAKQKAIEHFRPKKRDLHKVNVVLAEED